MEIPGQMSALDISKAKPFDERQYQIDIVNTASSNNTLVCLPTGAGKGVIAAMLMKNFHQQFPQDLIIFLTWTSSSLHKRLNTYKQMMDEHMSDPIPITSETENLQNVWDNSGVIFTFPNILDRALNQKIVPKNRLRCIVLDEAQKNQGFCGGIIQKIYDTHPNFRLLVLCNIPGENERKVKIFMKKLHITHIECRDEYSDGFESYIKKCEPEEIVVNLPDNKFREKYKSILSPHREILLKLDVIKDVNQNIIEKWIVDEHRKYQNRQDKSSRTITDAINTYLPLLRGLNRMNRQGLRSFIHFFKQKEYTQYVDDNPELKQLIDEIEKDIGGYSDVQRLIDDDVSEMPEGFKFGHEKFEILGEILEKHFNNTQLSKTRVVVFTEIKEMVREIHLYLRLCHKDIIVPQVLISDDRTKQQEALDNFNNYKANVLVTTQAGETGNIRESVDLVVVFDIFEPSAVRFVQRMRLADRSNIGHTVYLVTPEGEKEVLYTARLRRVEVLKRIRGSFVLNEELKVPKVPPGESEKKGKGKKPDKSTLPKLFLTKVVPVSGTEKENSLESCQDQQDSRNSTN